MPGKSKREARAAATASPSTTGCCGSRAISARRRSMGRKRSRKMSDNPKQRKHEVRSTKDQGPQERVRPGRGPWSLVLGPSPRGGFVFWILILMGLGTFAPCILLPEWRQYQALHLVEQAEQHRLASMRRVVEREKHMLEAM